MTSVNRRRFLTASAAAGSAAFLGAGPKIGLRNERPVSVACVGVGNRGETNTVLMVGQTVKAICDVDDKFLQPMLTRFPEAKPYVDWRELLEKEQLEALVVSTPDHLHAPIALTAMKKGLHVYIEKPIAHTIDEVRRIEAEAKARNLAVWMGNQHHISAGYLRVIDMIEANLIGPIKEVHVWTNRPTWLQGVSRPAGEGELPSTLNWDLWLGPAPVRPYQSIYHPVGWRGWWDFGGGAIADMGPHLIDPVYTGLKLNTPVSISVETDDKGNEECAPGWSILTFDFPARGDMPPLKLTWYDGGKKPSQEVTGMRRLPMNGAMCIGEVGKISIPDLGRMPLAIPNVRGEPLPELEQKVTLTRGHQQDWLDACRSGKPRHDQLTEACRLTELCLAGSIATRLKKSLKWDPSKGTFDDDAANKLRSREYREGWKLPG
jgi:predicted dehydrogenase